MSVHGRRKVGVISAEVLFWQFGDIDPPQLLWGIYSATFKFTTFLEAKTQWQLAFLGEIWLEIKMVLKNGHFRIH